MDEDEEEIEPSFEENRCPVCTQINVRKKLVECSSCSRWFHLTCVKLTRNQAELIPTWVCAVCREISSSHSLNGGRYNLEDGQFDLLQFLIKCRSAWKIIPIIPKGARIATADALSKLLKDVVDEQSYSTWSRLLCFFYCGLHKPLPQSANFANGSEPSLTSKIKNQIAFYMESNDIPIYDQPNFISRPVTTSAETSLKKRVSAKFADGDLKGAIRELSSDEGFAAHSEETISKLRLLHPIPNIEVDMPDPPDDSTVPSIATQDQVKKAIFSFPPGSSGGPDGLRPGHLKSLLGRDVAEAGVRLLEVLTQFINFIMSNDISAEIRAIFFGATLCALNKKDGGIRPIAIGNTLRRLIAKVALKPVSPALGTYFRPFQLGFATKGGCEAAAHAARQYLTSNLEGKVFLKIDMRNAFNCIRRDTFLRAVMERAPSMYRLIWQTYFESSFLLYGKDIIHSSTGIQQGDPCGPALFSLGIDQLVKNIKSELNIWYLDDASIADSPEKVLDDVNSIVRELNGLGLEINSSKCELTLINIADSQAVIDNFRLSLPDIKVTPLLYSSILGSPIVGGGVREAIYSKHQALLRMITKLKNCDPHQALTLLRYSFSLPKLQYILRSSPAYAEQDALQAFDNEVRLATVEFTNISFTDSSWTQATLPLKFGGIGLRCASDVSLPCYISSLLSVSSLVRAVLSPVTGLAQTDLVSEPVALWSARCGNAPEPTDTLSLKQKAWDLPIASFKFDNLLEHADQVSRARLLAAKHPDSGCWLSAIPVPSLGTHLDSNTLRIAISLRVGSRICEVHGCRCGRQVDGMGLHLLSCRKNAGRFPRHSALNDIVCRALKRAGIPSVMEPVGLDRGDGKRPDGITIFPFKLGRSLCWDVTCVDTYSEISLNQSAILASSAAAEAERSKCHKYRELAHRFIFEPIALETTGVFGPSTRIIISEIGSRIAEASGDPREKYWFKQRLSLAVQRGNAITILSSVRATHDLN